MYRKYLIALFLLELMTVGIGALNAAAKSALKQVQIIQGINQKRPAENQQTIGRRYVWKFQQQPYTVLMGIDVERYNSYASKQRYDIPKLVEEGTAVLADLILEFRRAIRKNPGWSQQDQVNYVLSFVQSLPYTLDDVTTGYDEFRRYAIETLIEGGGDCEDTTILVGAILRGLGEKVALIRTPGHIALGVNGASNGGAFAYRGTKYYYCETTGTGWTVGELPPGLGQRVKIVPLTTSSVPLTPEPAVVETPGRVQPTSTPPTPVPTVEPKKPSVPAPSRHGSNAAGAVIIVLLLLIGVGGALVSLVVRYLRAGEDSDVIEEVNLDDGNDEAFDSFSSQQHDDALDK